MILTMSNLFVFWCSSLGILIFLLVVGVMLARRHSAVQSSVGTLRELFSEEIYLFGERLLYAFARVLLLMRPFAQKVIALFARVRSYLVAQIFGKINLDHRSSSSFFLKHIAEHQELLRRRIRMRERYHDRL